MPQDTQAEPADLIDLKAQTTQVVAAYVSRNAVSAQDLPGVISTVYGALAGLGAPAPATAGEMRAPAVPIRKSVTPDFIVCLEDGRKLKMLKRHLRTAYDMSPDEYRAKWGLPPDYPMVAPNYAEKRSAFAKSIGLGRKAAEVPASVPAARNRPRKKGAE